MEKLLSAKNDLAKERGNITRDLEKFKAVCYYKIDNIFFISTYIYDK